MGRKQQLRGHTCDVETRATYSSSHRHESKRRWPTNRNTTQHNTTHSRLELELTGSWKHGSTHHTPLSCWPPFRHCCQTYHLFYLRLPFKPHISAIILKSNSLEHTVSNEVRVEVKESAVSSSNSMWHISYGTKAFQETKRCRYMATQLILVLVLPQGIAAFDTTLTLKACIQAHLGGICDLSVCPEALSNAAHRIVALQPGRQALRQREQLPIQAKCVFSACHGHLRRHSCEQQTSTS